MTISKNKQILWRNQNMTKIDKYLYKCIKDAYESENRTFDAAKIQYYYIIMDNKQFLFMIDTPFARVTRKAINKIKNNIAKHFDIILDGDYYIDSILQPNFVCNHIKAYNKDMYVCKHRDIMKDPTGEVIPSARYEKLCMAYHNVELKTYKEKHDKLHLPHNILWNAYRNAYYKAFSQYPEANILELSHNIRKDE